MEDWSAHSLPLVPLGASLILAWYGLLFAIGSELKSTSTSQPLHKRKQGSFRWDCLDLIMFQKIPLLAMNTTSWPVQKGYGIFLAQLVIEIKYFTLGSAVQICPWLCLDIRAVALLGCQCKKGALQLAQKWCVDFFDHMILFDVQLKECLVLSVTSVVGAMFALMVPSVTISAKANAGSKEVCQGRIKLICCPLAQS